jgi:hypothetical protein
MSNRHHANLLGLVMLAILIATVVLVLLIGGWVGVFSLALFSYPLWLALQLCLAVYQRRVTREGMF